MSVSPPYESCKFDWLCGGQDGGSLQRGESLFQPWDAVIRRHAYPFDPTLGEADCVLVELPMGMSIFQAHHRFLPPAAGLWVPIANVSVTYSGETLAVQVVNHGLIRHQERFPQADIVYGPGQALCRFADRVDVTPLVEGSADSRMTCLTISRTALNLLVGGEAADHTLAALGLSPMPKVVVRTVPEAVLAHLHNANTDALEGVALRMFIQARVLDFLSALVDHLGTNGETPSLSRAKKRAQDIHHRLTETMGKLPTLEDLALEFNACARTLNSEFKAVYGQSIYAFISEYRLRAAYEALKSSDVPLKVLASRLGYTHPNHFVTAFRKRFGQTPGGLRQKNTGTSDPCL